MITTLTICVLSLIAMLKWHSQPATSTAAIAEPTGTDTIGRFGYEDNSIRRIASLFKEFTAKRR